METCSETKAATGRQSKEEEQEREKERDRAWLDGDGVR